MPKKRITLGLQGGGSHGAFTWGALERLLEDGRFDIEAISGASAGAINAALLASGHAAGGRDGALNALSAFWKDLASAAPMGTRLPGDSPADFRNNPAVDALLFFSQFLSPTITNPLHLDLLRGLLAEHIDIERLRSHDALRLFVSATRVATGTARIFSNAELTLEVLLASACLPALHHPVHIDGEAYWDGGLTANPPLRPLFYQCDARDMVIVAVNPRRRDDAPSTARDIRDRLSEISFNAAIASELQGIAMAKSEVKRATLPLGRLDRRLNNLNLHMIEADEFMRRLDIASRLNTDARFIHVLRDEGRHCVDTWLDLNFRHIGARSSLALAEHLP